MNFTRRQAARLFALPMVLHTASAGSTRASTSSTVAATPEFREAVQSAMLEYIDATAVKGCHLIFDPVKGDYISAYFKKLHPNLSVVEDTFYVYCADFVDLDGNMVDVDYMVADSDGYWAVFQAVIHQRDGKLRETHMENAEVLFARADCGPGCCASKCTPKGCASKGCAPKGCAPKGCAPKGCAPKGCAPKGCAPKGCAPKGCAPKGCAPKGCAPKGCAASSN